MCTRDASLKGMVVDDFKIKTTWYFLTHAHRDHIVGLTKTFQKPIVCTSLTRDLLVIEKPFLKHFHVVEYYEPFRINNIDCMAFPAYHCDGSAMFLIGDILYTGDFRLFAIPDIQPSIIYYDNTLMNYPDFIAPTYEQTLKELTHLMDSLEDPIFINVQVLGCEMLLRELNYSYVLLESDSYRNKQIQLLLELNKNSNRTIFLGMRSEHDTSVGNWIFLTLTHFLCKDPRKKPNHYYVCFATHPSQNEVDVLSTLGAKMIACKYQFPEMLKC